MELKRSSSATATSSSDVTASDDPRHSSRSPLPQQLGFNNTNGNNTKPSPNYKNSVVQEALEQLASIDLIDLCHEAKVEHCRASRDLSSCGRYVQHVLSSCGHASLCAECSQRCDVCPICRTSMPNTGSRLRLRLYNKCIEAGLISKRHDDRFQEKERYGEHLTADVLRLYSLFDVALENNLVSLVCHYVTDVCLDESAVSSDPVLAFLLDEVVVKDWCKQKSKGVISELRGIYALGPGEMESQLGLLLKLSLQLNGICNVIEVLESSFTESLSTQLYDLHLLSENTLKAKQHLEVMTWCIRHHFLKNVDSRYPDYISWSLHAGERKSAAVKRMWPDIKSALTESAVPCGSTLFIEDALSNLRIQQGCGEVEEELDVSCLQEDGFENSELLSSIDAVSRLYPFRNLRAAADILFLFGMSDMVVAKQAIFLYYLFDRHWTMPDTEWRHVIDDFATSFGINRRMLLESLVFYLLDDHSDQALQRASQLLPEIAAPETHPKIAQVLLERERPDVALMVLRCSGHDGFSAYTNIEREGTHLVPLNEAVTAIRVRVECGLLTEAFMYARMHCFKAKELKSKHNSSVALSDGLKDGDDSWVYHVEVLVTEICSLCIRRNFVDRMIELPWNSDEEKYFCKCLFDNATQKPSSINGSLLVVFFLQRCRYIEAYQVDRKLQNLEQKYCEAASEAEVSRIRSVSQWRAGLVDKSIDLLPEVQRLQVKNENSVDPFSSMDVDMLSDACFSQKQPQIPTSSLASSSMKSSLVLQTDLSSFLSSKTSEDMHSRLSSPVSTSGLEFYGPRFPSVHHQRILPSHGSPSSKVDYSFFNGKYSCTPQNGNTSASSNFITRGKTHKNGFSQGFQSRDFSTRTYPIDLQCAPCEESKMGLSKELQFQVEGDSVRVVPCESTGLLGNGHSSFKHKAYVEEQNVRISTSSLNGFSKRAQLGRSQPPILLDEARVDSSWSFGKGDSPVEDVNIKGGPRWRADESSEDEAKAERLDTRTFSAKRRSQYRRR